MQVALREDPEIATALSGGIAGEERGVHCCGVPCCFSATGLQRSGVAGVVDEVFCAHDHVLMNV